MSNNDWKSRLGVVYSTNPGFNFDNEDEEEQEVTLPPSSQKLIISIDRRNRGGKQVTLITGFKGTPDDLNDLGKLLRNRCGAGGSSKDGEIIVQGDFRDKILTILTQLGYKAKRGN